MEFLAPGSVAEAIACAEGFDECRYVSGGTAVVLMLNEGLIAPDALVSLRCPDDGAVLRRHGIEDGELVLGGGLSLTDVAASKVVRQHLPSLATACRSVGNLRVRNAATIGGNVAEADYASDPPPVLVNLDARFVVRGPDGERSVAAEDMFLGYLTTSLARNEVVTEVRVPVPEAGTQATYLKYSSRSFADRPCVGVAAKLAMDDKAVRTLDVVVGATSGSPQRQRSVTESVVGHELTASAIDHLAAEYGQLTDVIDDVRGSARYRREMVCVLVGRALRTLRADERS